MKITGLGSLLFRCDNVQDHMNSVKAVYEIVRACIRFVLNHNDSLTRDLRISYSSSLLCRSALVCVYGHLLLC